MGIRTLTPPPKARRQAEPVLTDAEIKAIVKALNDGQFPGPDEDFDSMKVARKVIARWVRELDGKVDFKVGTRVWEDPESGKFCAALRAIDGE